MSEDNPSRRLFLAASATLGLAARSEAEAAETIEAPISSSPSEPN